MKNGSHKDVRRISAAEICARFDLNRAAHSLLKPDMSVREFAEILIANDQYAGAIDLIAHALSSRHAVWWGCLCLQHSCGQSLTVSEKAACKAAVEWVQEPTEAYRTAAKTPSEMLGSGTPAGALAAAAHTAEERLSSSISPIGDPGSFASARLVAIAVKLAAIKVEAVKISGTQRLFIGLGLALIEGSFLWPQKGNAVPFGRLA
jgi:uncharacterized protein DUF6931